MENNWLNKLIEEFLKFENEDDIKGIYNEFSLQHELGIFLRNKIENGKVLFERNIKNYLDGKNNNDFCKKEIDIVIECNDKKYAIELKFARNEAYPRRFFQFIKDVAFMEKVKNELEFTETYCLVLVNKKGFMSGEITGKNSDLYKAFRDNIYINHKICYKDEKHENEIKVSKDYNTQWKWLDNNENIFIDDKGKEIYYYLLKI